MSGKLLLSFGIIAGITNDVCNAFSLNPALVRNVHQYHHHHHRTTPISQTPSCLSFQRQQSQSRQTLLYMGWGPDPIWEDAIVSSNEEASKNCVSVSLKVSSETAQGFTVPGQYCQVKFSTDENDKPIFLAVASPPPKQTTPESIDEDGDNDNDSKEESEGEYEFEFLIKKTENNGWITDAKPGAVLQCSQVMGGGFPMDDNFEGFKYDFPTQNILMFAAGSGIAPIRSAIESGMLNISPPGKGGRTARLYYGARTIDDMPYIERFANWELSGVEVVPVLSSPAEDYSGRSGYVQTALEEDGVAIPRNSGALMCGMKGMAEAVKEILSKAGVFEGRILTNF